MRQMCITGKREKAVLTEEDVREIRRLTKTDRKNWPQRRLAMAYGVSRSCISMVIQGRIWKHVS